jgi:hypothetical protein
MKTKEQKLVPLDEFRDKYESDAAAARALEVDVKQMRRWLDRETMAGISSRKLARLKGVALPERT